MLNRELSWHLHTISVLLELSDENFFKVRAFRNASREIKRLTRPVTAMLEDGSIEHVEGVGSGIIGVLRELVETGKSSLLDELRHEVSPALVELASIPGIGAKTARSLVGELGVQNIAELEAAAEAGKVRELPGFGPKKEQSILEGIKLLRSRGSLAPIGISRPLAEVLVRLVRQYEWVAAAEIAGSVRRWQELNADIDLIAATADPDGLARALEQIKGIDIDELDGEKLLLKTSMGLSVRIWLVPESQFALHWLQFTGSKGHVEALRALGSLKGETEADIYRHLGLHPVPPELRQPDLDLKRFHLESTPPALLTEADIRGDLHMHTLWSDGVLDIAELAELCHKRGYEYIAITDHSPSLAIARGLSEDKLSLQLAQIRARQHQYPLTVLAGIEVDIRNDGSLDLPDSLLAKLDWVVASVHSQFKMSREQMTARIEKAMANPHVNVIGHPSGRLLQRRPGYDLDWERMFAAALRTNTALEVNSSPDRLDINDKLIAQAIEKGVKLVISTDAHSGNELDNIRFGVATARRAGAGSEHILNCMSLAQLNRHLKS
ncbi:MAG: PHP domain-containing protein [Firmicutes bacterium]|nr:PHP domain-containing protein [Bacillota bacterium]